VLPLAGLVPDDSPRQWAVAIGLADRPWEQRQTPFRLDLAAGSHLLVVGGPRSGRTTALHTLAGAVAAQCRPTDVHVYVLDCGGGRLVNIAQLPHCGAAVPVTDTECGLRLLERLLAEVQRRGTALAESGYATAAEHRAAEAGAADARHWDRTGRPWPWMLLLVDSWESFVRAYEPIEHGRYVDLVVQLLREGAPTGLTTVLTGDRGLLTSRAAALVRERLVLRPAETGDYALAGLPLHSRAAGSLPGRGLFAVPDDRVVEVQLAVLGNDPSGSAQARELARLAGRSRYADGEGTADGDGPPDPRPIAELNELRPFRVRPLPPSVSVRSLEPQSAGPLWTAIGVGGDDARAVGLDLAAGGLLVAGPPGSGRSTALAAVVAWHL
jgi:S-DNA-T family DNA segregation ATPase FtsK/SpoIIIE